MKKIIFPCALLSLFAFLGCEKFPPYNVTIHVKAVTMDSQPLANQTIFCKQTLFNKTVSGKTDAKGELTFSLTTQWDESSNDRFLITSEKSNGLIPTTGGDMMLLEKNQHAELTMIFDKTREQKVRFVTTSNRVQSFLFDLAHGVTVNNNLVFEYFQHTDKLISTNRIAVNALPKDTTISFTTGEKMFFTLYSTVQLTNPTEQKEVKKVLYQLKETRPDTTIVVKF